MKGQRSVASSKDRQRKLARAKLDRQMARRAARERRRRRILAGVGSSAAVVLIVAGIAWIGGAFDSDPQSTEAQDVCAWTPQSATSNTNLKEVGTPPTKGIPTSGTQTMTVSTNQGAPIVVTLDNTLSPCGAADLAFLAGKKFFDNTDCHEITSFGAVRCGDPSGTGTGGPTYSVYNEDVPTLPDPSPSAGAAEAKTPLYPKGTVAFIGDPPGTNGSQFLIFFKDYSPATPEYSVLGTVTGGLATVEKIGKIATVENQAGDKVKPKSKVTITSLTVGDTPASAAPSASTQS
jgi:peptidyl-prolyl cis-trans isomerase B (cyclophilin B)